METQAEIEADIVIACAGRAAEALKFPSVTTGAASDIQQATEKARRMVTMYGMSEKFGMVQLEGITGEYLDRRAVLQCSDETETKIDTEVRGIIKRAYERAYKLLKKNEAVLDAIAGYLYEHETITGKEFVEIFEKVSGKKVDMGKRLLSDSLLKSEKEGNKEKQKQKNALRKEGYYGVLSDDRKKKDSKKKEDTVTPDVTSPETEVIPQEEEQTAEQEPREKIPMPWETFAMQNSGRMKENAEEDSSETIASEDAVFGDNASEDAVPGNKASEDVVSGNKVSDGEVSEYGETADEDSVSEESVPGDTIPEEKGNQEEE